MKLTPRGRAKAKAEAREKSEKGLREAADKFNKKSNATKKANRKWGTDND